MSSKKTFLIMLITLILITMGGAWASDDHAMDEISASDDDAIAVDSVDDTQKDTSVIKENLTSQKTEDAVKTVDSESNKNGEILGATSDDDVLGEALPIINGSTVNNLDGSKTYTTSGISLTLGTTIYGHGCTISGNNANKIFDITNAKNIKISDIKFIKAKSSNRGGAVIISGNSGNITFINCIFEKNTAASGGAVGVSGTDDDQSVGSCSFINCTFNENTATASGTIAGGGAFAATYATKISFENCSFYGNTCPNNDGGAIYLNRIDQKHDHPNTRELNVTNCNFTKNYAKVGGAIKYSFTTSSLYCDGCIFKENQATNGEGADISIPSGKNGVTYDVINSKFRNSEATKEGASIYFKATSLNLVNCSFDNLQPQSNGGAVYALKSGENPLSVTIDGCNFTNVPTYHAVYIKDEASVNIKNSKFEKNTATESPAIYFETTMTSINIQDTTFKANTATTGNGGAFTMTAVNFAVASINGCDFINNKATTGNGGAIYVLAGSNGVTINKCNFTGNNATSGSGGAIYLQANINNAVISNSVFDKNTALSGGAIHFEASGSNEFNTIDFNKSDFTNNKATGSVGGAAITFKNVKDVDFDNCKFIANVATAGSGALYFDQYNGVNYNKCTFTNNRAANGGTAYYRGQDYKTNAVYEKCVFDHNTANNGGVIYNNGEYLTIKDSNFTKNNATNFGGVIYGQSSSNYLKITNSKFDNNIARNVNDFDQRCVGGVIYTTASHVNITSSNFTNNGAWSWGGVIMMGYTDSDNNVIKTADLYIDDCDFINNGAKHGGVVNTYQTTNVRILHSDFKDNYATGKGGSLYLTGADGLVNYCTFTNNSAVNGSAIIYIPPPVGNVPPTKSNITNCVFVGNKATGNATLWFESSEGKISNCNFTNNTAQQAGAIKINTLKVTTDHNNFIGNNATNGDAGAIYVTSISGQTTISYSNFTNNHAKGDAGAVYFASDSGIISNSRFINNTAYNGGAIVIANKNINVSNSYFNGNNATSKGGAIYALAQTGLNVSDSTFEKNHADNGGAIYYRGNNNGLCIYNDNFTGNIAEFNGGAVYYRAYLNNAYVPLSDYLEFSHHGTFDETSKRVTWTENNVNLVFTSLFKDNLDYIMNAAAYNDGLTGYVSVTVPKGARRPNVVVNVTVVGEDGNPVSVPVIYTSETEDGDNVIITYRLDDVLTEGKYNATVGFKKTNSPDDDLYLYKEDNVSFTLKNPFEGDFEQLQNLINEVLYNATQGLPAVLNLTRNYNFTENWDVGPLNIYGTITINGNGFWIDAKGHTRIFYINASDVVLNDIVFKNGNANGDNSTSSNKLQGGAILIEANNCKINNCTFTLNNATQGGAVFIQNNATGTIINHSTFTENNATYGTAIYVNGSSNFLINDTQFNSNVAKRGGAVIVQGATGNIANSSFISNEARFDDCAGISITESNHVTVSNVTFSGNTADIYVGQSEDVLLYNLTISNSGTASSSPIYINSNVTIIDLDMSNWNSENAIIFYSGNSTVSDSTFDGSNPILIGSGAEVHLTGVNNTNNNGDYSVDNSGKLYLKDNNFTNVINNHGNIETNTTIRILDNQTIVLADGEKFKLNITMFDDNGNIIKDSRLKLYSNTIEVAKTFNNDGYYYSAEKAVTQGVYAITANANELGLTNVDYQTALIKVKTHDAAVELNISKINHGEKVVFKANVTPSSTTGNVTFYLEGIEFGAKLNYTMDINETTGIATLTLKNLTQDTYRVTAVYNGDDTHFPSDPTEGMLLIVLQLDSKVQIKVNSTIQGNDVIAVITSNATTGTVNVTFKGVTMELPVDENGTATWNLTKDFTLAPDTYSIQAYFNENDYYKASLSTTTFQVYEYDIKVEVNETQFNESATIKVTINPVEAQGKTPVIYVDGVQVTHVEDLGSGVFIATTDKLTEVKEHNVNVTYEGNGTLFPAKEVTTTFNVTKAKDYAFDITVTPQNPKFGENVTVNITGPAGLKVNVTIDDDVIEVTLDENGSAIIKRDNLTAGPHTIKANTTGNENYSGNAISEDFTIDSATPQMTINVTQPIAPTSPANVTVTIGKNATGTVVIYIDGKIYDSVEVKDGVAIVPLDTTVPGNYTVTAKYYSDDDNYKSASNMTGANYTVDKYDITMTNTTEVASNNSVKVTVNVNGTADGNVTIKLQDGTTKTVDVKDGVAVFDLGIYDTQGTYKYNVTYNGDKTFNNKTLSGEFTVGKLTNGTINVTVEDTQFGDNATITIRLPADAIDGTLTVKVNDTLCTATPKGNGVYEVVTKVYPVGDYPIVVTYTGDSKYADMFNDTEKVNVVANSSYSFNITVTPQPVKFGENVTINITGPAGENVTVYIDGVNQTVTLDENGTAIIKRDNLTAGSHSIKANITGDENYTTKEISESFSIDQQTPSMEIIVPETIAPTSQANVTVIIGKNATGKVIITVDGVPTSVNVINGTAVLPLNTTKPGVHNITAEYFGDGNYTAAVNNTVKHYTIEKYNTTISVASDVASNNRVTVTVNVNSTAGGNVTIFDENGNEIDTLNVTDGVVVFDLGVFDVQKGYDLRVVYNGDKNFNGNESTAQFTVGKLTNGTINVTVEDTQFGDNATITIKLPSDATGGTLTVKVNDTLCTATPKGNGVYEVVTKVYPVGNYPIVVTYTGDSKYADMINNTEKVNVVANSSYPFKVEVNTAPYGENTTINVTGPAGVNVTVYVDDVPYNVTINENGTGILKLDNITAGHHTITANFTGDDNYTTKEVSKPIDIVQQTPDIQIIVPQTPVSPNSTTNVTVIVGKNATGRITIKINDNITTVDVINGTAVLPIKNIQPGTYAVTAEFYGDSNYNGAVNDTGISFTVNKYDPAVIVETPVVNDNNSVNITVRLNNTAGGKVNITINGVTYNATVTDGVAVLEIAPLANGTYNEVINYSGDGNFNGENDIPVSFEVSGLRNFNVTIDITEGKYGENTTITVHVPAGADGNVTIYVDGKPYPATINPDGTATIELPLGVGDHTINATFNNSSKYAAKNSTSYPVTIEPQDNYPFNVTVAPAPFGNDTVITVSGPARMKVNVTVDDEVYELTIRDDGTVTLTLDNLTAGKHNVEINSEANKNYTANANSTTFEIPKQAPEMGITISEGRTPNENVTVTVKVGDNATGIVSVTVDGKLYDNVEVKDGVAQFNVTGLKPNEHTIDVKYLGDDNYNASDVVSKDIKMDKYASTVEVRNWERDEDNNVIVSVYVSGDDGNVTIKVGDKTYNATVNDGVALVNMGNLPVEDTIINVSYTGDENYAPANITDVNIPALQIVSYPLPVEVKNITYGGDATVKVTLPEDWSGDLRLLGIKVDDDYVDTSDYHVDGNVVTVTIKNPKAGEHAVEVSYEDGKYAMLINETSFSVDKAPVESSNITVNDPIEVGEPLNVTVDLPKDANGTITVDINGTKYIFDVVNGSANISIPNLGNGTYKVNVTYSGDDNYDPISIAKEVTVNKVDPEIKAETSEIKLGEPAIIDVTLPDDATGTVTIKVGNVEKTVPVAGGLNHISVENIPVGENQTVIVTYNGNDKYAKDTITTNLTVKPQDKTPDEFKVDDKGNGTIIVTVPENATGNITIKIGNETYEVPIEDGKAVIDIANETNQTPGVHEITVIYTGDGNNTPVEFNSTANVPKWDSVVNVNIPTIREGDIAKVNVTVTSKDNRGYVPNGTVRVEVDGKGYFGELINGNVIVDVPGLGNGTHTVKVTYDGNDYYLSNSTTETVTVQEAITVKVNGTGNSSEIVVKLPEDATQDQVEVFIDGKNETDRLTLGENGTAKVNLTGIEPGVHNVTIKYTDEDGTVSYVNTTVNVPKWSSSVNATAATIREGDPAIIKVTVGKDMTGEVKVKINGTGYIATVDENGEATITAYGLKAGNHTAVVTYLGSDKYEPSNATFKVTVQAPITVEVNGTGNGSEVVVKFPEGTKKDQVNVTIDGKDANDRVTIDKNGTAKVNLTGIEPGEHNITIKYTDEDGTVSWVNTTVNVPKWSSSVNATAAKIREGDPAVIKVKVNPDMTGEVKVVINGTGYIATVDENGEATITAYGLKAGEHSAVVTYLGSDKYEPSNATFKLTVQEPITVKINGTGNSSEVIVKFPEGTTKDQVNVTIDGKDANGRVTIDENGTAKVNLTGIEPGEHNITIKYTDEDGTVSWVNTTVNVPKWSSSVNATAATIREGDPAVIKVKVSPDMQGEVKVVINGTGYIATVDENGEATITAYGLKAGEHSAVVTYLGSDKYEPSNATFKVTVQEPITVKINGTGNSSEVIVKFPEGTTKDQVNVTIDGKDANDRLTIDENGTAKVNLTGIEPGEHNITIKYTDKDGTVSWVNTTVNVPKWSSVVNATAATIREGDPAVIKVKVSPDMQGEVKVVINGTGYIADVDENGEATITAYGLKAGNHTAVVTYLGSYKYEPSNATFKVTVQEPITVKINGTGNSSEVVVKFPEGTTKDQVNVTIDGKDANNRLTIDENGTAKVNLTGIEPGEHNITIKYTDKDGTVSWVNTTVNVPKWSSSVNATAATIREGDPAVIKVKVNPDMQGEVKVVINGTGYIATVDENGEATITAYGLKAGNHTAVVTYLGSDKYEPSNATFKLTVQEPITVKINGTGNSSEVVVKFPEGTTKEQVNVTIDGKDANDRVTIDKNGTAKVNLTGIEPGEHNITIKYTDEDGTVSWVNTTVNVPKWSSAVNATAATIREGDVAVINVQMDANETGRVLVNINGTGYYADLKDGKAIINAPGLKAGTYNATVSYEGDKKYDPSNNTFTIVVQAPITINVNGTGNSSEVVVQLPKGANETSITITVDGNKTLPVTVDENGTARANLTGLEPGEHNITVKYVDPDGTVSYVNTTIDVPRWSSAVNATAATIREGDVAVINVKMDANETGRVLVDINGTGYYADLKDGKAIINAPGLKAGTYNATVTYEGDAKYDPSNNTFQIIVQAPITIDVNGTGNSSEVVVKLPEGATDKDVNITVDGNTTLPVTVDENGTARANLTGLEPGEHNITVKYVDPDGTVSYVNTTINVPRWSSAVNATAPTIREGDVAEIQVKVDSDETGTVYVDIDGTGYYGTLEKGVVTINAPGIKAGTYTGNVTYLGDRKYDPSNNTFTLTVESAIEIDLEGAGNSSQVVIKLPENGTDNVNVTVDGKQVPVKVENGTAIADLSGLPEGEHNVTVVYTDKDGRQSVVNKTIKIYKSINVADEITRGWNSPYDAEAEFLDKEGRVLANTTVEFTVNGKTYKVKTDDKGIGKLTDSHLAVGKYDLTVKNPVTGEEVTSKLTIVKRLIENKDVTTDYLAGKYYTVKAIGDDGKPVGAGEVIGITVNGVGYVIKTDKNGVGKLKINLVPKKYTLKAEYAKYKVTNNVVVKQTLKLVKKTVKAKKGKKIVIKAKLKWSNGKAIKGKKITIKFKGKKFKAKTNKKGIAKITIKKKSVLKKLKKGKTYKFTAYYVKEKAKGKIKIKK